jgi:tetratricopeptide (TPR) repeat protein
MRCVSILLLVVFGLLLWAEPVTAQVRDRAAAEALFRAGREAMGKGDFEEACRRFMESNRLDPAVGTLFNLAACQEKRGRFADAWQLYQEVIDRLRPGDDRIPIAREHLNAIEPRMAHLTLQLSSNAPADAVVIKNGVELGRASLGVSLPANPGSQNLVVKAPGHTDNVVELSLEEGETKSLTLDVGPVLPRTDPEAAGPAPPPAQAPLAPPAEEDAAANNTLSYVLIGVGAAALIASLVTGAMVLSKKNVVEEHCSSDKLCDAEGLEAGDAGKTFSRISTASFAVGVVGLAAGTTLLLTSGGKADRADNAGRQILFGFRGTF